MLTVPSANWGESERLKWSVALAKALRWNVFTWNPPAIPATTAVDTTLSAAVDDVRLTGLRTGMPVFVTSTTILAGGLFCAGAWVPANDSLTVRLVNVTAAPIDPASATWSYFGVIL